MTKFKHLHVLNLIGVCVESGEAPYIIMPYMMNGSLLAYLRKEKPQFTFSQDAREEQVSNHCYFSYRYSYNLGIVNSYKLAAFNFVHRLQMPRESFSPFVSRLPRECATWQNRNLFTET